jgi:hypothetical protein
MTAIDPGKKIPDKAALDVTAIRCHFSFPACGRIVTKQCGEHSAARVTQALFLAVVSLS